ncbi:MAG: alpha/beta fold hydrolase [Rhodocyclaceae bacterium]
MLDVYLIHGLYLNRAVMVPLAQRLRAQGHRVHLVGHSTVWGSLARNAEDVRACIERTRPQGRCVVIGHSLGGVVATFAANRHPDLPISDIMLLGSPYHGSAAARALAARPGGGHLIGRPLLEWLSLRNFEAPRHVRLWTLIGDRALGVGQYIGRFAEQPNDGTVAVDEATIAEAHDTATLPVSHMQMLVSGPVAAQVLAWLARIEAGDTGMAGSGDQLQKVGGQG